MPELNDVAQIIARVKEHKRVKACLAEAKAQKVTVDELIQTYQQELSNISVTNAEVKLYEQISDLLEA